jgi:hypothetical protein
VTHDMKIVVAAAAPAYLVELANAPVTVGDWHLGYSGKQGDRYCEVLTTTRPRLLTVLARTN